MKAQKRVDKQTQAAAILRLIKAGWTEEQILATYPISRATYFRRLNLVRHLESPYATEKSA